MIALPNALSMLEMSFADGKWIMEFGSTRHICNNRHNFETCTTKDGSVKVGTNDFTE